MKSPLLPPRIPFRGHRRSATRAIALALAFMLAAPYASLAAPPRVVTTGSFAAPAAATQSVTGPYDPFFASQSTVADLGAAARPFGVAAGDFDGDGDVDLVIGRTTGHIALVRGNGDGSFAAPAVFAWKQAFNNAWAFAAGDVNGDGKLDVIWGASAASTGCLVSGCTPTAFVNDGDVRAFLGNGNGTFQEITYFVSGVRHNAGVLLGRIAATDAGSVAAADIDKDGDTDVVAGGVDGANSVVKLLRNGGGGSFTMETLISQPTACATPCSPIYFPAITTQNSPWGLSLSDADGDGDNDLWVGDRALYVYLYLNDGLGNLVLKGNNNVLADRPNVYLRHDSFRAAVGFTPSLASGDLNGDGKADVVLGLHSGTQTPASNTANDGIILLDVSNGSGHTGFGPIADVGTMARGVTLADVNADGALDILAAEYDGKVKFLRQLPPLDADGDGVSDYVDNAPSIANAARIDMNTDGSTNYRDQLDNDFDTALGNPEDSSTWQRLGDPADPNDDNDGVEDASDNCSLVANTDQANADGDALGDACDPLDNRDPDGDGVPTGPAPGDPLYEAARAAKVKWSTGTTHFVIRIDALGRFFQNEFTQLMTDAATLSPAEWQAKCWENYQSDDIINGAPYEPCGPDPNGAATLGGGKEVPVTLVVIPKQLWTDAPVIAWINDRNDNPRFELGQHGTYHSSNTTNGDWANLADRNFFSCETCGLTPAENFELLNVGKDTLLGNYTNKWVAESGATASSPKIDWSLSANPLISYAPPFNADDEKARQALAMLGFKAYSSSVFEESSPIFSPNGSRYEQFDLFGMFHSSADAEVEPPDTANGAYDPVAYHSYLVSETQPGGLNTWLIEEVEWSGRPCNDDPRIDQNRNAAPAICAEANGAPNNRENNTVYQPRWDGWLQLLDYVKNYPGGVVMTMGEVALAKGFDNAPTVPNPDQADSDHDGVGDVIDGASIAAADAGLSRSVAGDLSATLSNNGAGIANQTLTFSFDADGDGTDETFTGTTDQSGTATVSVTATRPVGTATYQVGWDGGPGATASASGTVTVHDATNLVLDASNPQSGQVTDAAAFGATLTDSSGTPLAGRTVTVSVGSAAWSATTDGTGRVLVTLTLVGPAGSPGVTASFAAAGFYGASSASAAFTVSKEDTTLTSSDAVASRNNAAVAVAVLTEADGAPLAGRTVVFSAEERVRGALTTVQIGTATTGPDGRASFQVPTKYVSKSMKPIRAAFAGDGSFHGSSAQAFAYRQ